ASASVEARRHPGEDALEPVHSAVGPYLQLEGGGQRGARENDLVRIVGQLAAAGQEFRLPREADPLQGSRRVLLSQDALHLVAHRFRRVVAEPAEIVITVRQRREIVGHVRSNLLLEKTKCRTFPGRNMTRDQPVRANELTARYCLGPNSGS